MFTIKNNVVTSTIINKSEFICNMVKVSNEVDVKSELKRIADKYKDASHNCFGYILENSKKFSDDGEPSGTAGVPILNVLEKNNLTNVLCVVTRYFGGIKLGAGGLVRAYSSSVSNALKEAILVPLEHGYIIELEFNYDDTKQVDYLLKNAELINKEYGTNIKYEIKITDSDFNTIENELKKLVIITKQKQELI